jgi:hypothetical protein
MNYKVYYTNTLQDVEQIVENIRITFLKCGYVAAKMQLRFCVIWEDITVEAEVHRLYQIRIQITTHRFLSQCLYRHRHRHTQCR